MKKLIILEDQQKSEVIYVSPQRFLAIRKHTQSILEVLYEESDETLLQKQRDEEYRAKIINCFFEYGKLKSVPSQQKKEQIILEVIAEAFEFHKMYTEREVNIIIADFFDDFCTIRKALVASNLLCREKNIYWRK